MTRPTRSLQWMAVFAVIVIVGCTAIAGPLALAFASNVWFNGVIVGVLAVGVAINVQQVVSLYPEIAWVEDWRDGIASSEDPPRLLSSMALLLSGRGDISLSATSLRTLLDSIRTRLEESRDLSRYFIGLLIFLGLLGTFWGLMATVGSVASVIRGMSVAGADSAAIFDNLKSNLEGPLVGMGVAFSSSLFGLAGSLVVGFLDLQAGRAQNRFVNELEEWLSGSTRLSSGLAFDEQLGGGTSAYVEALLEKTADSLERMQRSRSDEEMHRERMRSSLTELSEVLSGFKRLVGTQNERLEQIAHAQAEIAAELRRASERDNGGAFSEELRAELRLLSKTVANALSARDP